MLAALWGPAEAVEPPTVTAFFQRAQARNPKLSPSGRFLAIQSLGPSNRMVLAVIDLETLGSPKVVAAFRDADVWQHHWVSEGRLVFNISDSPDGSTDIKGSGLWAVDRDGSQWRQLIQGSLSGLTEATQMADRRLEPNWHLHDTLAGDGDEILVERWPWRDDIESASVQLARLDTRTGRLSQLSAGLPDYVRRWVLDQDGQPRLVEARHAGRVKGYLRGADGRWQPAYEGDAEDGSQVEPVWFGPGGLAFSVHGHRGYNALFRIDGQTLRAEAEPLIHVPGYDYAGRLVFDRAAGALLGVHYETDAPATAWFHPTLKAWQADIDAKLPGTANRIECQRCLQASHLIVTARSDQRPPVYLLYRTATHQLQVLAGQRPDLPVAAMGQRDYHRFKARDGLEIPVLVTQPASGDPKRSPTVVLVHGGPFVRGTRWSWEPDAQFLASRGYLVLEPEFRGSTGYGGRLYRAGWKQWGLRMQDDLADTLAWAVRQGWADPQRACIAGASYGGYAALMGAVTQGDLFRCAINWVGVSDIGLLSSIDWSDVSDEWKQFGMKRLIGDPVADAAQLAATSPLKRAAEIRIPLLMAYGGLDARVPIKHGQAMKAALRPDQTLEWVDYPDEGHGWFNLKTNEDFWGRVERFLARHLASPPPAGSGQP